MKKRPLIILIVAVLVVIAGAVIIYLKKPQTQLNNSSILKEEILIGFSVGTLQEERWVKDRDEFLKEANRLGVVVDVQSSNNDAERQIYQIRSMIAKGVDAIVIVAFDAESLSDVISEAKRADIKVIAYDRLIKDADLDLYLSFDSEKVGEYQAQYVIDAVNDKILSGKKLKVAYIGGAPTDNNAFLLRDGSFKVLQPKIDSGEIEIVLDAFSEKWNPENAYKNLKEYLQESGGDIDAVVAANDGTAFGSISALVEYNLDGKVPVSGQDAELSAIHKIIEGTQTVSVYKPIAKIASAGVNLAIKLVKGENIDFTGTINNGEYDIPTVLLESIPITKENISTTLIKDGFYTEDEIYIK